MSLNLLGVLLSFEWGNIGSVLQKRRYYWFPVRIMWQKLGSTVYANGTTKAPSAVSEFVHLAYTIVAKIGLHKCCLAYFAYKCCSVYFSFVFKQFRLLQYCLLIACTDLLKVNFEISTCVQLALVTLDTLIGGGESSKKPALPFII